MGNKSSRTSSINHNNSSNYQYESIQDVTTYTATKAASTPTSITNGLSTNTTTLPPSSQTSMSPSEDESSSASSFDAIYELTQLFQIALPTVAVQFYTHIIFPITASYVGRNLSTDDMAAFSLASLSGNLTCISIIIGTLSASETLQPRAFAVRDYEKVGVLALRGFIMCLVMLSIPVTFLMTCVVPIYEWLGQDPNVSMLSNQWIHAYIWSVPFILCFRVIQRFLASQSIVLPCVIGASISSLIVHPLLLRFWITNFEFEGSAMSIVMTQSIQLILTILYVKYTKSYVEGTWSGINNWRVWKKVFDRKGLMTYASLSLGGVFSLSEWWYWECICFVAGRLGVIPLCVHSVTYQILPLVYMIPLGISIGFSVRIGQLLPVNVEKAKTLTVFTMLTVIMIALAVTSFLYYNEEWIVSLFTKDESVKEGCRLIWPHVCMYMLGSYIFCLNCGILRALGLQWRMGMTIVIVFWCFSLPSIIYFCIYRIEDIQDDYYREDSYPTGLDGLVTMWEIFFWSYIVVDIGLILCYTTVDWNEIGKQAALSMTRKEREGLDDNLSYED